MRVTWRSNLDGNSTNRLPFKLLTFIFPGEDTDQFDPMDPNYWGYKPLLPSKGGKDEDTQQLTPADALTRASRMAVHLTGLNKSGRKIVLGTLAGMDTTIVVSATAAMMLRTERVAGEKPQKQGSVAEKASNVRNEVKGKKPGDGSPYASMPNFETLRGAVNTASTELRGYRPGAEGRNEIVAKVNEAQKAFRAAKVAWAATTEGKEILASFEAKSKNK